MPETVLENLGSGRSIVWALLIIAAGILAIALPFATSWAVVLTLAWIIIFSGVTQLIYAFQSAGIGQILWKIFVAILYVLIGVWLLINPILSVASLTLLLAIFFVIEGVMDLVAYFQIRATEGSVWILLDGIVTLLLGILVWRQWPSSSLWAIGTLVGISIIMTGTTRLMLSLAARRISKAIA